MGYEISTSQMQHDAADKKHNKIQASYSLEGTVLENVESIKYLGVTITCDLKWNSHIRNVCSKANRTLGFLRRNLFSCFQNVKEEPIKVWGDQSLSMEAEFGTLIVMVYTMNWKMCKSVQLCL